jgi:flagellar protein FliT
MTFSLNHQSHSLLGSAAMPQKLIDYYKAIESASKAMLDAAKAENWEQVMRLEGACAVLIEQLRAQAKGVDLSASERSEKQRIMLSILRHDAQIRHLAEPWLADLDQMLTLSPQSQSLH